MALDHERPNLNGLPLGHEPEVEILLECFCRGGFPGSGRDHSIAPARCPDQSRSDTSGWAITVSLRPSPYLQ